jgi:3-methyladenine DNA glycosylase AlkC
MEAKPEIDPESNPNAFKHFIGKDLLKRMSAAIAQVHPEFDRKRFEGLMKELEPLELKPRVRFLRDELRKQLPREYARALKVLLASTRGGTLKSFDLWPYTEFVQAYGLEERELSLDALKELTRLFTSEFAVRPFLKADPAKTLAYLKRCAKDPDEHVRRWASEGSRPRLPWGERLQDFVRDPSPTLEILELLKFDPELYVRKSVSNHLNDIAKDHSDLVVKTLSAWKKQAAGTEHEAKIAWTIHRALRTLIKAGHPGALKLIGVAGEAKIRFGGFAIAKKTLKIGDRIEFGFTIRSLSAKPQKLVVDYIIHFVKANRGTSPKVFKLKTLSLPAKAEIAIAKLHHLKKITTRTYYPGAHHIEIQINGRVVGRAGWELKA